MDLIDSSSVLVVRRVQRPEVSARGRRRRGLGFRKLSIGARELVFRMLGVSLLPADLARGWRFLYLGKSVGSRGLLAGLNLGWSVTRLGFRGGEASTRGAEV